MKLKLIENQPPQQLKKYMYSVRKRSRKGIFILLFAAEFPYYWACSRFSVCGGASEEERGLLWARLSRRYPLHVRGSNC